MTFHFRGARILDWRRVQADAARVAFVRATESVREAAARVAEADDHIARAGRDYKAAMARPNEPWRGGNSALATGITSPTSKSGSHRWR